jgi:hypothetical protein
MAMCRPCLESFLLSSRSKRVSDIDIQAQHRQRRYTGMLEFVMGYSAGSATASRAASLARSAAVADGTRHTNRIEDLDERIDELAFVLRGMWALLEDGGVTKEQLMSKLEELDMADGVADGRVTPTPVDCPSCAAKVAAGLTQCQYCGAEVPDADHPLGTL